MRAGARVGQAVIRARCHPEHAVIPSEARDLDRGGSKPPRLCFSLFREEPFSERWLGERPFPRVVVHTGVLSVQRVRSRFAQRGDPIARHSTGTVWSASP